MTSVEITITFTDAQAWESAQFLKRVSFSEYSDNATSDEVAYLMRDAEHGHLYRRKNSLLMSRIARDAG